MGGRKNAWPLGLDRAGADSDGLDLVEGLCNEGKMEARGAESLYGALRRHDHAGVLHRVLEIMLLEHFLKLLGRACYSIN